MDRTEAGRSNDIPGPLRRLAAAVCCAAFFTAGAHALDIPVVGGIDTVGADEKSVYIEIGAYFGTDSNVRRSPEGDEESDTALELLGGVALVRGGERNRFDLHVQARDERYSELSDSDFTETRALFGAQFDSGKILAGLRAEYASLADPIAIEITEPLERTRVAAAPRVDLRFSPKLELGVDCSLRSIEYADSAYRFLDHKNTALGVELRWGRRDLRWIFVKFNQGEVDYVDDVPCRDFDYGSISAGWRSDMPRLGLEVGVGTSDVEGRSFPSHDEVFYYARSTFLPREGRSIQFGAVRNLEAASNADYKSATRLLARYGHKVNERWGWSIGVTTEGSDYVNQDPGYPASLDYLSVGGGIRRELGSPGGWHGRLYVTLAYEKRSGSPGSLDYDRLRLFAGGALVR